MSKWQQELMWVERNDQGVIIGIDKKPPQNEGFIPTIPKLKRGGRAANRIDRALILLDDAKQLLKHEKNEQWVRFSLAVTEIKEIHGILTDPECTPEILEGEDDAE